MAVCYGGPWRCRIFATPPSKSRNPARPWPATSPPSVTFSGKSCGKTCRASGSSGQTKLSPTNSKPSTRSATRSGSARTSPKMPTAGILPRTGASWRCSASHTVEGWLEGYILSGRHGLINSYEPFIHVIDSMYNQHAKWLEKCNELPWRAKISSLNLLITALVWRQDHNGFTHQDPGFLDVVANKSPSVVRVYLPPDANCLLSVA